MGSARLNVAFLASIDAFRSFLDLSTRIRCGNNFKTTSSPKPRHMQDNFISELSKTSYGSATTKISGKFLMVDFLHHEILGLNGNGKKAGKRGLIPLIIITKVAPR